MYPLSSLNPRMFSGVARFLALSALACAISAQSFDASALQGRYRLVRLEIETEAGGSSRARNLIATLEFNGAGRYELVVDSRSAPSESAATSGGYEVAFDGAVLLDDPLRPGVRLEGVISADGLVLAGSALEGPPGLVDLALAVREAAQPAETVLRGDYSLGALLLPGGNPEAMRSAFASFRADGDGALSEVVETGHRRGEPSAFRQGAPSAYSVAADGTFETELQGLREAAGPLLLFASADGNYVIGAPAEGAGLIAGVRKLETPVAEQFGGLYWNASIGFDGQGFFTGIGTSVLRGGNDALLATRLRVPSGVLDLSRRDAFVLSGDGSGWLSPSAFTGGVNFSLGAADPTFTAKAGVGAGVDAAGQSSDSFGVSLLLLPGLPNVGEGLFADYRGVVHAASFAPPPSPLAPGLLTTIFGLGLIAPGGPASAKAEDTPLPTELAGVRVTVNGTPAPLLFVSGAQINFQAPPETVPGVASIVISNGREDVEIRRRVAATSPGLFFTEEGRSAFAAIGSHADGSPVTPAAPARPGETIVLWSTGFGVTQPAVAAGVRNPGPEGEGLARPVDPGVAVLIAGIPAGLAFVGGTPGFVGLTQLNVTIPANAPRGATIPVALFTSNAIQDQADLPIGGVALLTEEATAAPLRSSRIRRTWGRP